MVASALILGGRPRKLDFVNHPGSLIPFDFLDLTRIRFMQKTRFFLAVLIALAAAGCARQQQAYVVDPATGRAVPVAMRQQQRALLQYAQQGLRPPARHASAAGERGLFNWSQRTPQPQSVQPQSVQPQYARQTYPPRTYAPQTYAPRTYAQQNYTPQAHVRQPPPQPYAIQDGAPLYATPRYLAPTAPAPNSFASASLH